MSPDAPELHPLTRDRRSDGRAPAAAARDRGRAGAARRWARCRASCSCRRTTAGAPTATARSDRRGPDDLAALDRRLHGQLLELEGAERVLEVGTGSGYGAAVLSRLCARGGDDRALRSSPRGAADARRARLRQRRGARRRRRARRARPRALRRHLGHGGRARRAAAGAVRPARVRARTLVCPVERGGHEHLVRFRDGARGGRGRRPLRAAGRGRADDPRVLRGRARGPHLRGRAHLAASACATVLALPKGHPEEGETAQRPRARGARGDRARGRARREARRRALLVRPRRRAGAQGRHLLPVPLPLGQRRRPRPRGRGGALDPARRGAGAARLQGRARDGRRPPFRALAEAGRLPRPCSSSTSTRRCSSTSSSAAARPPRSGSATRARSTARARS